VVAVEVCSSVLFLVSPTAVARVVFSSGASVVPPPIRYATVDGTVLRLRLCRRVIFDSDRLMVGQEGQATIR
jgi:hypothetical protein